MADDSKQTSDGAPKPERRGLMTLVKALAFISVIVLLEIAAASMFFPDAQETRAIGQQLAAAAAGEDLAADADAPDANAKLLALEKTREVELGKFHVLTYDPETGASLTVDFELFGVVLADEEGEFYTLFEKNQQRISEQVNITMRAMDASDFSDPGLGLIRRKILKKVNRALGGPLLQGVVFPEFSYIER